MRVLVTGVAGFIGSHTAEALVARGDEVVGVDCGLVGSIGTRQQRDVASLLAGSRFNLHHLDLRTAALEPLLADVDAVVHLAALPGVRTSWHDRFADHLASNVLVTQRLLEAATRVTVRRVVYASSSSVYGDTSLGRCSEAASTAPHSPYGVTKLASEHLCAAYAANHGVPTVALRYFTVYGPRQRPDMALHRLFEAALTGARFELFGDGGQVRDLTAVADVVAANLAALDVPTAPGTVVNVAGGQPIAMDVLIGHVEAVTGRRIDVRRTAAEPGDVSRTGADTSRAWRLLGWAPTVELADGLARQWRWHESLRPLEAGARVC